MSTTTTTAGKPSAHRGVKVRDTVADRTIMIVIYVLLAAFAFAILVPVVNIVANSFSDPAAVSSGRVLFWPVDFTLQGYEAVFRNPGVVTGFLNSVFYVVFGTLISIVGTIALAYPLSRTQLVGRKIVTGFVIFAMLFQAGTIPTYMVVQSLGLLDTRWAILLPQAIQVWQVIFATVFFRSSIPEELYEAAQLDGASEVRILWSVVLPLAKPLIAVIALMYGIMQWNAYFDALLYLRDENLQPLQIILRDLLIMDSGGTNMTDALERQRLSDLLKYSLVVVAIVPMMIIYPFAAKHFNKGIMIGAVKG